MNKNDALRQEIVGITADYTTGGCHHFFNMTLATFFKLFENDFIDSNERQQMETPSMGEYLELFKKYPKEPVTLNGYMISPDRDDYRITIDTVKGKSKNKTFISNLIDIHNNYPDGVIKIEYGKQYIWYD